MVTLVMSLLGAFTNVLMWMDSWSDLTEFKATKTIVLGFVVGVLYYVLRIEHGFPDSVMSFIVGYFGSDFVEWVTERFGGFRN